MNLLSQRIKEAKRELTALKTAHRRGLGSLKTYVYQFKIPSSGHSTGFWYVTINIIFDPSYAPYPFVYLMPNPLETASSVGFKYTNSGRSCSFKALYAYDGSVSVDYYILSTSPITGVTYTDWETPW